jgi:hypothetical protein
LVELNWALCGMAVVELLALREQIAAPRERKSAHQNDPQDRSLANTLRALRKAMRNLRRPCAPRGQGNRTSGLYGLTIA